jgi:hypothetical protein
LLSGTLELLMTGGVNPNLPAASPSKGQSPRSRGMRQGLFIFLLTFLIVPIIAIITIAIRAQPFAVVIASILLAVGGLLRMAYAWMFEAASPSGVAVAAATASEQFFAERAAGLRNLPPQQTEAVPPYMSPGIGRWQDTNELEPASVTEGTTRLLENELDQ